MRVKFGLNMDDGVWPESTQGQHAVLGDVSLGPAGLIGLLETRMGLGGPAVSEAIRIRRYMERIQSLSPGSRFYSRSFEADAWATARELLAMRDELVLHGWDAQHDASVPERIRALAEIEQCSDPLLPAGLVARYRAVLDALTLNPPIGIGRVTLVEPTNLLPLPWRRLLGVLADTGVAVEEDEGEPEQSRLEKVILVRADQESMLAEGCAVSLSACTEEDSVALLINRDASTLDQALHALGLPATGQSESSSQVSVLQLLPLVLDNVWQPVRIERLINLLANPMAPLPRFAADRLLRALRQQPGLEGDGWHSALKRIAQIRCRALVDDGKSEAEAESDSEAFVQDIDQWLHLSRQPMEGADTGVIIREIERLQRHLGGLSTSIPLAAAAMGHCRDLVQILSGIRTIDKPLLDRIVDDVIGPARSGAARREAAPWGVITDASQLLGPVGTLIWWGFVSDTSPRAEPWTREEREWLARNGVALDDPGSLRILERSQWLRAASRCQRLVLLRPNRIDGEPKPVHPLWYELQAGQLGSVDFEERDAIEWFEGGLSLLAAPGSQVTVPEPLQSSVPEVVRSIPPNRFQPPERLSPTSLDTLFGCPFKWLLKQLRVETSPAMSVTLDSAAVGSLAHQVLEDVFAERVIPEPDVAEKLAGTSFDRRVPEMAADLLLPEFSAENHQLRRQLTGAARDLAGLYLKAGFDGISPEEDVETSLDGIPVRGTADAILLKAGQPAAIVDYKHSESRNFYVKKIEKGRDVQLAAYARMLDESRTTPVGYYLVPRQEMVTVFREFGRQTVPVGLPPHLTWQRIRSTWAGLSKGLREGRVPVWGLLGEEEQKTREAECEEKGLIYHEPPCRFCDYASLCGLRKVNHG